MDMYSSIRSLFKNDLKQKKQIPSEWSVLFENLPTVDVFQLELQLRGYCNVTLASNSYPKC